MLENLLTGLPTMAVCLLLQAFLFVHAIRYYGRRVEGRCDPSFWSSFRAITGVMLILVIGNVAQVTVWATLFRLLGEFESLTTAIYHSAVNFATLGYGDIVMSEQRRLLGPLEAINGAIMIGMSTAAMMAAFQSELRRHTGSSQG